MAETPAPQIEAKTGKLDLNAVKGLISRLVSWIRGIFTKGIQPYWMQQREYRERCVKLTLYYQGVFIQYLNQLIAVTAPRSAEELKKYADVNNITQFITDSVAQTFKYGVQITANNEADQEIYKKIVKDTKFGTFVQSMEAMTFLLKQIYVKIFWSDEKGIPQLEMILPQFVDVIPDSDDSHEIGMIAYPAAYSMNLGQIIPTGTFHVWTEDSYGLIGENGMPYQGMSTQENVQADLVKPNPYGVIPIVPVRVKLPTTPDFFMWPGTELEYAQDNLNMDLTFLRYIRTMQSWGVPVLYGASNIIKSDQSVTGRAVPSISYSPSTPIMFSDVPKEFKAGLEFVSPAAKIAELEEGIDKLMHRIKEHYGLQSQGAMPTRAVKAADTLQMENSKLEEYRDHMKEIFGYAIQDIFELITIIFNAHSEDAQLTGEGVRVKFLESDVSKLSVDDKIKETDDKLTKNLTTIVDVYIEESDEDITRDDAEKQIIENAEINARVKRAINALNPQPAVQPQTGMIGPDGKIIPGAPPQPGAPTQDMSGSDKVVGAITPAPPKDPTAPPAEMQPNPSDQAALDEIKNRQTEKAEPFEPTKKDTEAEAPDQPMQNASDHRLTLA